jgi:hypothetical protein
MRGTLVNLGIIVAVFFSCGFFESVLMIRQDTLERQEVAAISHNFPVVVVSKEKAQIVYGEELEEFKRKHSDYSFLVPAEKYKSFQEQINSDTRAGANPYSKIWDANFKMESLAPDREKFVVYATWDDDRENTGEYEATDKEVFPKYQTVYFGPGKALLTLPFALLLTAALWIILAAADWLWRRKNRAKQL